MKRLLIANRGEVAVRIARACRELGIESVAAASEADRHALHVREADRAVVVGPAPASQSYLAGERLIEAAKSSDCQAIHPGYGFLSQSADFAEAIADAGLVFVGPPASAMRLMGDKTAARQTMIEAGVPVVPGHQPEGEATPQALLAAAREMGFPVLVKAAAGGGGKGMRVVRGPDGFVEAARSAAREAEKAFGDGRLFLERYVERAHHVEIQVLADSHGNCLHLFERECSLQRRYQKIVEESPSPLVDDALRQRICQTAVEAARACGYVNAGTVEFLVSEADGSFYFLEMNTRLQVEHPVTEMVTGVDIVRAQIEVAMGKPLPYEQGALSQRGHAIECRLYAEDPANGFAPSTGCARRVVFPRGPGIRVDAGIASGDEVPVYYDPMVAKIIVHAETRTGALARMAKALDETVVLGLVTNRRFVADLLAHPTVARGRATTRFVEEAFAGWQAPEGEVSAELLAALAVSDVLRQRAESTGKGALTVAADDGDSFSPWARADGFRIGAD